MRRTPSILFVLTLAALAPPATEGLAPLQRAQYALMRGMLAEGRVGWLEFLLLASGGAASPADANTSYVTPIVFHLVRPPTLPSRTRPADRIRPRSTPSPAAPS